MMIKLPMGQSARLHQVSTMYISSTSSSSSSLLICTLPTINITGSRFWVKPERIPFNENTLKLNNLGEDTILYIVSSFPSV